MFVEIKKGKTKSENYKILLENLEYFLSDADEPITSLSNLSAYLNYFLDNINWVGFYLMKDNQLHLGPFQGLPACTTIKIGVGVCGNAAKNQITYVVHDVDAFPGHIACDGASKSEIVIPIIINEEVYGVLDIDSPQLSRFDETDKIYLEKVIDKLVDIL